MAQVVSPVTREGSKVGSVSRGESPGSRSAPGKRHDSVPAQPSHGRTSTHQELPGGVTKVTGPEK